jgi:hypothetical protein
LTSPARFRRAAAAHGKHEKRIGKANANWPDCYAEYLVKERTGEELPQRKTIFSIHIPLGFHIRTSPEEVTTCPGVVTSK